VGLLQVSIREEQPEDVADIRRVNEEAFVVGHPEYYPRFGFVPASRHNIRCQWEVPDEAFMVLVLDQPRLHGTSGVARYRDEFAAVA
jgi:putative acetyltransferase